MCFYPSFSVLLSRSLLPCSSPKLQQVSLTWLLCLFLTAAYCCCGKFPQTCSEVAEKNKDLTSDNVDLAIRQSSQHIWLLCAGKLMRNKISGLFMSVF